MTRAILDALRAVAGDAVTTDPEGLPRVLPRSTEGVAAVLRLAHENGWRIRVEGGGTWMPTDAPAEVALSTTRMDRVLSISPADLVATAQAGARWRELQAALAGHRARLALDPPGAPDRTLGSILATGTAGPLRHRFGPVRDQILGTTVVGTDGRIIRAGGIVVKNVAGYDLTKIQIGGFGAFGIITEANLRLRALPAAVVTLLARGPFERLLLAGRELVEANADLAVLELCSPAATGSPEWTLVAEAAGTQDGVAAEVARARDSSHEASWNEIATGDRNSLLSAIADGARAGPITLRFGVLAPGTPDLIDLLGETIGHRWLTASLARGGVRWCGDASNDAILSLRRQLAEREIPVTLERAPWPVREALGHFGALREGVRPITARVRSVFDPRGLIAAALEGTRDG